MGRTSDARERLIRAAISVIFANSYASASVDDLCVEAGVTKSSFYHFFPSKLELALAALDHYWTIVQRRVVRPAFQTDIPPLERLLRMVDLIAAGQAAIQASTHHLTGCMIGNLTLEMSVSHAAMRAKSAAILAEWQAAIVTVLRDAQAAGEMPATDLELAAQAILAYIEGVLLVAKSQNDSQVIARLRGGVLLLASLGAEAPTS